jgi:hypothetical protein
MGSDYGFALIPRRDNLPDVDMTSFKIRRKSPGSSLKHRSLYYLAGLLIL